MITELEETRDFKRVAEVLSARGWAEASAGNMSLRLEKARARPSRIPAPGGSRKPPWT